MGRMQRVKGSTFERKIANELRRWFPEAKRGIGQTRSGGDAPDVEGCPWWIECKHRKSVNVNAAYAQAMKALADARAKGKGDKYEDLPIVISRTNGGPVLVTVEASTFATMLEKLYPPKLGA